MEAVLVLLVLGGLAAPVHAQQQTDTTFAVDARGQLRLDNHQGAIRIRSWDRAAMRVAAVHASGIRIDIRRSASVVRIEGEAVRGPAHGIDYDITVPRAFAVRIDGVYCDVVVQDVDGDIVVDNVQGDIIVRGGGGRLDLESVDGEISVTGARGLLRAENVNSGIRVADHAGNVFAESVNGAIQLEGIEADSVRAESVNGNILYRGALRDRGRYRFSTHNGNIGLTVPPSINATVRVSTHSGSIETDFPVQVQGGVGGGRLSFTIGNGGARLDIESFNGTIRLSRPNGG